MKKLKSNISATIIILYLSFLVFCACAVDTGYVITARFKMQKITETAALYMASVLKSYPLEQRTAENLSYIKESFENLYTYGLTGYYDFKISKIDIGNEEVDGINNPKIKVQTSTYIPTLFLRFAGIGKIKILQSSAAISEERKIDPVAATSKAFTYRIPELISDKKGNDFKVEYANKYIVFAGIKDSQGEIHWSEMGKRASSEGTKIHIGELAATMLEGANTFDMSKGNGIGLIEFIRIYNIDEALPNSYTVDPPPEPEPDPDDPGPEPEPEPEPAPEEPEEPEEPVASLNYAKLAIKAVKSLNGFLNSLFFSPVYAEDDPVAPPAGPDPAPDPVGPDPDPDDPGDEGEDGDDTGEEGDDTPDEDEGETPPALVTPQVTILNSARLIKSGGF